MATGVSDRKAQIIFEATHLFSQEGYDGVTMKRLAAACGITEPALYRHFTSKDALYNRVLASTVDRLENKELFHRLENESDVETLLTGLAGHILSFYSKNADLYRLLLFAALSGHTKASMWITLVIIVSRNGENMTEFPARAHVVAKGFRV